MCTSLVAVSLGNQGFCSLSLVPEEETECAQPDPAESWLSCLLFTLTGRRWVWPPHFPWGAHETHSLLATAPETHRVSEFLPLNCLGLILYQSGWRKSSISPHVSREDLASGHHFYRTLGRCRPSSSRRELPACLFPHQLQKCTQIHRACETIGAALDKNLEISLNVSLDKAGASVAPVSHAQWQSRVWMPGINWRGKPGLSVCASRVVSLRICIAPQLSARLSFTKAIRTPGHLFLAHSLLTGQWKWLSSVTDWETLICFLKHLLLKPELFGLFCLVLCRPATMFTCIENMYILLTFAIEAVTHPQSRVRT